MVPGHIHDLFAMRRARAVEQAEPQSDCITAGFGKPLRTGFAGMVARGDGVVIDRAVLVEPAVRTPCCRSRRASARSCQLSSAVTVLA